MPLPGAVEVGVVVAVLLVGEGRKVIFKLFAVISGSLNNLFGVAPDGPKLALVLPIIRGGCEEYSEEPPREDATGLLLPIPDSVDLLLLDPKSGRFNILPLSKVDELDDAADVDGSTVIGCNLSVAGLELLSCGGGGLKNNERGPSLKRDKQD